MARTKGRMGLAQSDPISILMWAGYFTAAVDGIKLAEAVALSIVTG